METDPHTVFENPTSMILTKSTANKFFPEESVIGKKLTIKVNLPEAKPIELIVSGIVADPPINSSIEFSIVFNYVDNWRKNMETLWLNPVLPDHSKNELTG